MSWLETLTILAVMIQAFNFYLVGKGETPYLGFALAYLLYGVVELILATSAPAQSIIGLFVLLDVWCMFSALRGFFNRLS